MEDRGEQDEGTQICKARFICFIEYLDKCGLCVFINTCRPTHFVRILQVIVVDLLYGLEVYDSFHLGLVFVCSREY